MSAGIGFVCCFIAIFCFGSSFVPVKKFNAGDGIFFQWVMCMSIWLCGLVVQFIRESPQFEPIAMLGGVLWACGNTLCVPVMHYLGIGLGMLIWCTSNLVIGWASGRFGFFGIKKQDDIAYEWLNILGVLVCMSSLGIYFFVKTTVNDTPKGDDELHHATKDLHNNGYQPVLHEHDMESSSSHEKQLQQAPSDFGALDQLSPAMKQVVGFGGAMVAGVFFGLNFVPPQYLIDHPEEMGAALGGNHTHSTNSLDYVFSHFSGILMTSTFILIVYAAVKKNKPSVYPEVILPAFASGLLWALAQISWFIANQSLSFVITYPLISSGPGLVASLWGIFAFGEITGRRNYIILCCAAAVCLTGAALIAISKLGV